MRLDPRLHALIDQIDSPIRAMFRGRSPSSLYEPMAYVLEAGGKRIRPLLLALSCESVGGSPASWLDAALAVELLHTFTLVHDDIMDHDDLRRGRPTVHKQWDEATAILTGDGLVTAAYASLLHAPHPAGLRILGLFTESLRVLCEGQALDKSFESRDNVSPVEYLDMVGKKTAALIEAACEAGAVLGNGTRAETGALKAFGRHLGIAFQIQDDLLDVASTEAVLGKPVGSDIAERKKTYLSIHFRSVSDAAQRARFEEYWGRASLSTADVDSIQGLFEAAGTLQAARQAIASETDAALKSLEAVRPGRARDDLRNLALALLNRDH